MEKLLYRSLVPPIKNGVTAAIVIVNQTTQHVRNLLTDTFRRIARRVARADGSTIFFLDAIFTFSDFKTILNFLDQEVDGETRKYLTANNIRESFFA